MGGEREERKREEKKTGGRDHSPETAFALSLFDGSADYAV